MKTRTTLLLLGVLLVLAGLAVVARRPGPGDSGTKPAAVFPGLDAAAVRAVRIARPDGEVALERAAAGWTVGPDKRPADGDAVERLLGDLAALAGGTVVSTNPAKRGTYELEEGQRIEVRLEAAGGTTAAAFAVGTTGPDFASSHIALAGDDRVLLVPLDLRARLGLDAAAWRDRRALDLPAGEITAVRIEREGATVLLERGEDGSWRVDGAPADAGAVERYLGQLTALRAAAFADAEDAAAGGFDRPAGAVTVEAPGRSVVLTVGALREGEGRRYLRSGRFAEPLLVPAYAADGILKPAAEFASSAAPPSGRP